MKEGGMQRVETPSGELALSAREINAQVQLIQEIMAEVMKEGEHYGAIPGTDQSKKVLLKSGAEKLMFTFRLAPEFKVEVIDMPNGHREYRTATTIRAIKTGALLGSGVGSCSTMESKYRWRNSARVCPACGKEAIIKGKEEYGGGWLCFKKKDGCGEKFSDDDLSIVGQVSGKVENPDIADVYNTALKISKKRSLVDATLTVTAASDIFTQDIDPSDETSPGAPDTKSAPKPGKPNVKPPASKSGAHEASQIKDLLDEMEVGPVQREIYHKMFKEKGPRATLEAVLREYDTYLDKKAQA